MDHLSEAFPLGAAVTLAELDADPHPVLARLRAAEPVSWLPGLGGWVVTRHDLVLTAMRDPETFTVDDPRFSTAQVIGPSMLSLDGAAHARHRAPFVAPFRAGEVGRRFTAACADESGRLLDRLARDGGGDLRRGFTGPMAAAIVTLALGLDAGEVEAVLAAYEAIVASVTSITAGDGATAAGAAAFAGLASRLRAVIRDDDGSSLLAAAAAEGSLSTDQIVSNAAVLLFGGIETTDGMIANAVRHLLLAGPGRSCPGAEPQHRSSPDGEPQWQSWPGGDPRRLDAVIDESLRLEPAAAVIDRYATTDACLGGAPIGHGDLVRLSIAGANRDPAVFPDPDRFDPARPNLRRHVAFAQGPHVCVGVHLARLEARTALAALLRRLPHLRLDDERPPPDVYGLVFRKPRVLYARWD